MTLGVAVWPHPRIVGWDGRAATLANAPGFAVVPISDALSTRHPTDAHATGYQIPSEDTPGTLIPRLTTASLATLIDNDAEPIVGVVFVDVDRPEHAPWTSEVEAAAEVARVLEALDGSEAEPHTVYSTRAGLRLVFAPATPPRASVFRSWCLGDPTHAGFLSYVSKHAGIPIARDGSGGIDPTCSEWTRCYRLPYVVRDGAITAPTVDSPLAAATWTPKGWSPTRVVHAPVTGTAATAYADGVPPVPDGPHGIPDATWHRITEHPTIGRYADALRAGKPLARKGSRDTTLVRVLGALVGLLATTDALDVWAILARSVAADDTDGAPTLGKLWEKCRHFASREGDRQAAVKAARANPPIVYSGSRFFTLDHARGTYRAPVPGAALCSALEGWGPPGIPTRNSAGKPRETSEMLADFGRPAVQVIAEMGRERTEYDPTLNGGTLFESCCVVRADVAPVYHADVGRWLDHLGGEDAGLLLDWLATITDTDHPTCALYLEGPPAAGKGMLAAGIAALWGVGATAYADAVGNFNGSLAACPIVHIDEGIAVLGREGGFSSAFRTLIGETSRPLRRKFMEVATIVGCPRVLITANNADALRIRERLNAADIAAIAQRILYVKASDEAGIYLESVGGRRATDGWVSTRVAGGAPIAGKIAQHVLWLRANRAVNRGSRFLVHGKMGDFHRDLALTSGINGDALAVVAYAIEAGKRVPGIEWGDGAVACNVGAVRRAWSAALQASAPGDAEVAGALRALACGQRRVRTNTGRLRHYEIPPASVLRVAELLQIGDADHLLARINAPSPNAQTTEQGTVIPLHRTAP